MRICKVLSAFVLVCLFSPVHAKNAPAQQRAPAIRAMGYNAPRISIATGRSVAFPRILSNDGKRGVVPPGKRRKQEVPMRAAIQRFAPSVSSVAGTATVQNRGCAFASSQPAPIAALVSGLKCDPDLIFEYVYNNIEFESLYGSNRGALGTLLDGRGDDADQAILLVTLWNAAGFWNTGYYNEGLALSGAQIANWLDVSNDCNAIQFLLNAGGIPFQAAICNEDGTMKSVQVNHFVAALQLNGTWYYFDASFKRHTVSTGVSNLASVMGYSQSQFLADVGGTQSGYNNAQFFGANRANLRADLTTYSNNVVNYNRTAALSDIIGGKTIIPLVGSPIRVQEPGWTPSASFPTNCPNQTPALECRSYITITMNGALPSQSIKLYGDAVYGHRIVIYPVPGFGNEVNPTLLIDGAAPGCVPTCANVGHVLDSGEPAAILSEYTQPNQPDAAGCETGTDTECQYLSFVGGGTYLVSQSFGSVGRGTAEYHRQLLEQAVAAGNANTTEIVLGETLATISYNWLAQLSNATQVIAQLTQTTVLYHIAGGLTGQWNIQQSNYQGPYVDLPLNALWVQPWNSNGSTITVGNFSYSKAFIAASLAFSEASSSFESAVLLETQSQIPDITAASTMMLADANMNPSYPGSTQTTFLADGTNSQGLNYFNGVIYPTLSGHYSTDDLQAIYAYVNSHQLALLPENGQLAVNKWQGAGYATINPISANLISIVQKISGGMSGGFTGTPDPIPSDYIPFNLTPYASSDSLPITINLTPSSFDSVYAEPVDSITGAYVYSHDDLVTGSNKFPYALPFIRTYVSAAGSYLTTSSADIGLGNGWSSNYNISAQVTSDPYIAMGTPDSPAMSAATSIAALYVLQDLASSTPTTQTMTASAMVVHWFTDQLTNNVVQISKPNTTEEYTAAPHLDGATTVNFNPPPGSSVRLTQTAPNTFEYLTKDGVALNFAQVASGASNSPLQTWQFPNGMTVTLSYNNGQLSQVTNNLGRSLTLGYTGDDITSVTDDTSRFVSYGYDGKHNLVTFTDPLLENTNFYYDTSGVYDSAGHLTQISYPANPANPFVTNSYDRVAHVSTQANGNKAVSSFYIAQSRSELVDALGNREVTYQTDRGKVIKDVYVLSSAFGDVFNDTVQQNGVVNVTTNQYDGIDRLVLSTAPEGDSTALTYDATINPWANNIASVTKNPKPQSQLQPITQMFTYDPHWNKATQATDGLGLITMNSFDLATGNLMRSVADFGNLNATSLFAYSSVGQVLTSTDPVGPITRYTYDSLGNEKTITRDYGDSTHLNQLTQMGYNSVGDVTSIIDANNNETDQQFDTNRRKKMVTLPPDPPAPGPLVTNYFYDPDGNLLQTQQSANGTLLRTTSSTYTSTDKVQTSTDANGNTTTYAYDPDDHLASTTDPYHSTTSYVYDAMSRQIQVLNTLIQPAPLLQKSYRANGSVASLTDANGNSTTYDYDGFNRLKKSTYPTVGGSATTEQYTYDADNNVLSFTSRNNDILSYAYDTLNRLCSKAQASTATPCSATTSANPTTWYVHDLAGRLAAANDNNAQVQVATAAATYTTSTTYDALNHPRMVIWSPAPSQAPVGDFAVTFSYWYDKNNRRIKQAATDTSWWNYPSSGETVAYTSNALNQYTQVGSFSPLYNPDGNLVADGSFQYGYDAENRMTNTLLGEAAVATYSYDALGRRMSKTAVSSGTTTMYVVDPDGRELLEYDGTTGATNAWYAYGVGSNDVLNRMNVNSGNRDTMIPDIQGSIIGQLKSSNGTITKIGYQSFGENPGLSSGSFRYTAQRFDPETAGSAAEPGGLYYYRSRVYSPALGRFFQPDPVGYQGGMNMYAYVDNDPLNKTDPTGNCIGPLLIVCIEGGIEGFEIIEGVIVASEATEAASGGVATATALETAAASTQALALQTAAISETELAASSWTVSLGSENFTASSLLGNASTSVDDIWLTLNGEATSLAADPLAETTAGTLVPESTPGLEGSPLTSFADYTSAISAGVNLFSGSGATLFAGTVAGLYDAYSHPGENGAAPNLNEDFQNFSFGALQSSNVNEASTLSK